MLTTCRVLYDYTVVNNSLKNSTLSFRYSKKLGRLVLVLNNCGLTSFLVQIFFVSKQWRYFNLFQWLDRRSQQMLTQSWFVCISPTKWLVRYCFTLSSADSGWQGYLIRRSNFESMYWHETRLVNTLMREFCKIFSVFQSFMCFLNFWYSLTLC